eukprot:175023_1
MRNWCILDIIDELFAPRANSIGEYEHSFVDVAPQAHVFKVIIKLSYGQCCTPCDLWNRFGMARNKAKNNGRRGGGIGRRNYNQQDMDPRDVIEKILMCGRRLEGMNDNPRRMWIWQRHIGDECDMLQRNLM